MFSKKDLEDIYIILGRSQLHELCKKIELELQNEYDYTFEDLEALNNRQSYVRAGIKGLDKTVEAIDEEASIEIYLKEN